METDFTKRFSDRVANYVKYRPGYPSEIISFLSNRLGLSSTSSVADIGSGTGISTEMFLKNGNRVFSVEPNDEMRKAAESALSGYSNFYSLKGTAENTGLQDKVADFVVAAQAFHWFEPEQTKKEFHRILKEDGRIVLIWNDRKISGTPFAEEYDALITLFGLDYKKVKHKNIGEACLRDLMGAFEVQHFVNHQDFDFDGLLGRLVSSSYVPNESHSRFSEMRSALKHLFEKHQRDGLVRIEYDTQVYHAVSRPNFIKHYSEIQEGPESSYYRGSKEYLSIGSPFAREFGLTRLGIHHEVLPSGRRTSWPHAESAEEEFVYVIEGNPDAWINGDLYRLNPGDAVGFPSGTGISHTFINNTDLDVRLLVVGEVSKKENKIYYPLNPSRREECRDSWWHDILKHNHGPHDGLPDKLRGSEALGPLNYIGEVIVESLDDTSILNALDPFKIKCRRADKPTEKVKVWNINRYCLDERSLGELIPRLETAIDDGEWYTHFFSDLGNKLYVIFKDKHFVVSKKKDVTWDEMNRFGESIGLERGWSEAIPVNFRI